MFLIVEDRHKPSRACQLR